MARLPYSFHLDRLSLSTADRFKLLSVELRHSPNAIPFLPWHVADAFIYKYQCCRSRTCVRECACTCVGVLWSSGQRSRRSFPRRAEEGKKKGRKEGNSRLELSILVALANRVPSTFHAPSINRDRGFDLLVATSTSLLPPSPPRGTLVECRGRSKGAENVWDYSPYTGMCGEYARGNGSIFDRREEIL